MEAEAQAFTAAPDFGGLSLLRITRDVCREALRLYPPVPMMVQDEALRERTAGKGTAVVLSP